MVAAPEFRELENDHGVHGSMDDMSFADMLETYGYAEPSRGQILRGTILEKRRDEIILDLGLKRDAIVTRRDLVRMPEDFVKTLAPGQEIYAYVLQPYTEEGDLIVSINKALELEDWTRAEALLESNDVVEGIVLDVNKGGILVRFGRLMGFVPNSHIESAHPTANQDRAREVKEDLVGQKLQLKVIQVERARNRLILSERAARRAARSERLGELKIGQVVQGRVVNLTDFGAFVDLGGVDGMIHVSNIDHRHVRHPQDVLSVGDEVTVRIDAIDLERERIALNRKAILPDPWDAFIAQYEVGSLVEGEVTNVVDFGIFVATPSGAQGLVHTSRMSSLGATPRDMFRESDAVLVRIVGIDLEQKHIEMSVDEVTHDEQAAWMHQRRQNETQAAKVEEESYRGEDVSPEPTAG
jgi:small subunit ribosomal protein S1